MCYGQILESRFPKARKVHRCMECGKTIEAGVTYHRQAAIIEGDFQTSKTCAWCHVLELALVDLVDDGFVCWEYGSVRALLRDAVQDQGPAEVRAAVRRAREKVR